MPQTGPTMSVLPRRKKIWVRKHSHTQHEMFVPLSYTHELDHKVLACIHNFISLSQTHLTQLEPDERKSNRI